jgi:hypothetical protein
MSVLEVKEWGEQTRNRAVRRLVWYQAMVSHFWIAVLRVWLALDVWVFVTGIVRGRPKNSSTRKEKE